MRKILKTLHKEDRGTISMIFGLLVLVLTMMAGIGIDFGRTVHTSSAVSSALDAAILATARRLQLEDLSDTEARDQLQAFFEHQLSSRDIRDLNTQSLVVTVDRANETLQARTVTQVETYFARIGGFNYFTLDQSSTASYRTQVVELGLMLDVTGSMSGPRIDALRLAASDLIDEMIPEVPRAKSNRIALAPYAGAVNVAPYDIEIADPANGSADGCVIERTGPDAATDAAPDTGAWYAAADPAALPVDIDPADGNSSYGCPAAALLPLSNNKAVLTSAINGYTTGGWTSGHLGAMWAWNLISPNWDDVWGGSSRPAAYDDEDTIKAVILMTDGNFNTSYNNGTSDAQALQLCTNMKAAGVVVFSVAFEAPAPAEQTLRTCASSPTHYFDANNGAELRTAFRDIASRLTSLRLTQ